MEILITKIKSIKKQNTTITLISKTIIENTDYIILLFSYIVQHTDSTLSSPPFSLDISFVSFLLICLVAILSI